MTATITYSAADEKLIARDESGKIIATVDHDQPITASSDSHEIAHMVFEAGEILSVEHDGGFVHVTLDADLYASRE